MPDLPVNRGALSVQEFCAWASIGQAYFYREQAAGRLPTRKIGRKTVVLMTDAQAWLNALPAGRPEAA